MRFVSLIALVGLSVPAIAQEAGEPVSKPAEKKICRVIAATGSIMGKRECRTKAEWDAIAERSKDTRDRWDRESRTTNGRTGVLRD